MNGQLRVIVDDLEAASGRLAALRSGLSPDAWCAQPAPARWSPVECVEHLNLTSRAFLPLLRAALDQAAEVRLAAGRRYRRDPVGWLIWAALGPTARLRTRTAARFVPAEVPRPDEAVAEFERLQGEVIACVRAADRLAVDRVKVVSPFAHRVRYSLYSAMTLLPRHQHRHLHQAERAAAAAVRRPLASAVGAAR